MRPTTAVAVLATLATACSDDPATITPPAVCDAPYQNVVDAAAWAQTISPTRSYHYVAGSGPGFAAEVRLLDGKDAEIATMQLEQVFGDASIPDGTVRAELDGLTLSSTGRVGPGPRHEVHADLTDGTHTLRTIAVFEHRRCFEMETVAGPPCASDLALAEPGIALPSCGLIADNLVLNGVAPVLTELEYRVPDTGATPTLGGRALEHGQGWHRLEVRSAGANTDVADVAAWSTQVDTLLGSDAQRLLSTAFLDRTWWRALDEHIAHCSFTAAGGTVLTQALGGCGGGDCSAGDWNQGGGSGGGNNGWGDPHMTTLDGHAFDFQGGGEFVLVRSTGGDPLEIQMRTETAPSAVGACTNVTWVTAVSVTLGDRRIGFYARPQSHARIDGQTVDPASASPDLPAGASLTLGFHRSTVRWPDGTELWLTHGGAMQLGLTLAPERSGEVAGILGNFDGQSGNDLALADGEVLSIPAAFADIHGRFAEAWRIDAGTSLFDYESGEDTSTFALPGFPTGPVTLEDLPEDLRADARTTCLEDGIEHEAAMSGCILDTVCATEPSQDTSTAALSQELPVSHQAPGESDVAVGDAVERKELPDTIDDSPWSTPADVCTPRPRRHIALYRESGNATLASPLDVGAPIPGRIGDTITVATLPAGTAIDTWLLHRAPGTADEVGLEGFARFARPILGVLAGNADLDATDASLGGAATYDADSSRGVELGDDWLEISADRHQVRVRLTGTDLDQVRVLTEVNP